VDTPYRNAGVTTLARERDPCRDAELLGLIGRGEEEAMAEFYRRHSRILLAQILLVTVDDTFLADQPGSGPGPEVTALDRAELAEVTGGQAVGGEAREHLATCGYCTAEAARWDTVAGGVRGLMATAPEAPPLPGVVTAQGTVQDAGAGGFTVITSGGAQVAVTTSSETNVNIFPASLSQLAIGTFTVAIGQVASDGTLAAITAGQPGPGFSLSLITINGCTPSALDAAVTTAFLANG
jgi:hypothetical protein